MQVALREHLIETGEDEHNARSSCIRQAVGKDREVLKQTFVEGIRMLLVSSCDCRLEVTHWMVEALWKEGTGPELVEWFFMEAENQVLEVDEGEAKDVERMFGSR